MKAVCAALGVARSNVHLQAMRAAAWIDGRTARRIAVTVKSFRGELGPVAACLASQCERC